MNLVISSSGLSAFRRCPKSYQIMYEWGGTGLQYMGVPGYVNDGADFHTYAAEYARYKRDGEQTAESSANPEMYNVFADWMVRRGHNEFRDMREIMHIDNEPIYTLLAAGVVTHDQGGDPGIDVYLRTTFDLVYRDADGWIVVRDYKTFEKMPSLDADLDFQARCYIAAIMRRYKTSKVRFEHVYVRRVPPGTKNSRGFWSEEQCYVYEPIVIDMREAKQLWSEAQATAEAVVRTRELGGPHWWRTDLKGNSPFTCGSCFQKAICKAELQNGSLDETIIDLLNYVPREPLELPKELVS